MTVANGGRRARRQLIERIDFELDEFQVRALDAVDRDDSVLVAAPTSAGKTLVAEYAIDMALASGAKAFYTTPIKALSNQKYGDFLRRLGADRVGLLTGDNAINGDAPVVVMTTEVLRNMIYAGSPALDNLRYVILDEVHYLQDAYRGPVWEEVIIHAPPSVRLVCLSATVSNAGELAEWISTVRGATEAVVEERRPVELQNLYMVGDRSAPRLHLLPTIVDDRPNPEASRLDAESLRAPVGRNRLRRRYFTPGRVDVVEHLAEAELLPAIYFIFSRAACDDAAQACVAAGLRLTGRDERARIRDIVEAHTAALSDADLTVLGYDTWLTSLELGIAAHHAGMVPPFKEAVEACFAEGLIRAVFATETLALGINMPARTVVIEKLSKFTGERHEFLTPGDYTQLTGRAGRRGIDQVGYAVVLWSPFVPFDQVAALAASRSFRLTSSFRPTYNMAANLVYRYSAEEAHHLLNLSFAQYQADRSVVSIESRLEKRRRLLGEADAASGCSRGDTTEYHGLVQAAAEARRHASPKGEIAFALSQVRPGSVLHVDTPRIHGKVAVLTYAQRRNEAKLKVITTKGKVLTLGVDDFHETPEVLGEIELPLPFAPNNHNFQHRVARDLQRARVRRRRRIEHDRESAAAGAETAVHAHPVDGCPDRATHVQAQARAERLRREIDELQLSVRGRTESLARRFDRVLRVLEAWGHLDGWEVTDKGSRLRRLYHECDLLIAECLDDGVFDGLDPPELAGLVSVFTYEHRSPDQPAPPRFPSPAVRTRFGRVVELTTELNADEQEAGLPLTRSPDPGFIGIVSGWAAGGDLDHVLSDDDMSGGDFVRNVKQVVDLLRQLGDAAPGTPTRRVADEAADAVFRGVVAASAAVGEEDADDLELAEDGRVDDPPTWGGHHLAAER
ncbi:MAG: DEAD/DEAH box helicase [Acidimicrobiales bacterium]